MTEGRRKEIIEKAEVLADIVMVIRLAMKQKGISKRDTVKVLALALEDNPKFSTYVDDAKTDLQNIAKHIGIELD